MIRTHTHTDRLQATIGKPEYVRIGRCLFKAMMPTWDEAQAQQSAEDDWEQDAKGKPTIDRRGFGESMFQVGSRPAAAGLPSALVPPPRADAPPPHHSQPRALRHVTISHTSQETPQSRLSRRLNASAGRGSPHPSSCTPPTNLGLVGARTARHDREPGGLQVRVRVSLAEEKGHQATALLAELG